MERILRISLSLALLAATIVVLGCSRTVVYRGGSSRTTETVKKDAPGPPPHAPAHGYRHRHSDGVVLVYDSEICVYVVSGYKSVYYYKGHYYRWYNGRWQTARRINGPWLRGNAKKVPSRLQKYVAVMDQREGKNDNKRKDADKGKDTDKGKGNDKEKDNGKGKDNDKGKDNEKGKGNKKGKDNDKGNGKGGGKR